MRLNSVNSFGTHSYKSKLGIIVPLHRLKNGNVLCWKVCGYDVLRVNKQTIVSSPRPTPPIPDRVHLSASGRIANDVAPSKKTKRKKKAKSNSCWPCIIKGTAFKSYKEYLRSDLWAIRRGVFSDNYQKRCGYCENACTKPNLHHLSYKHLGCEKDEDLVWLCEACHHSVHATNYTGKLKRFRK